MNTKDRVPVRIGNYSVDKAKKIREALEGETYMDFDVTLGIQPGPSRTVTVYGHTGASQEKVKDMIIMTLAHNL